MSAILTITLNPALDVATSVPEVHPDEKLRCSAPLHDAGGGGVNVARAIGQLGGRARAFVALAGHSGDSYRDLLSQAPLEPVIFDVPGDTRRSLAVTDQSNGSQYRFMLPGPTWDDDLCTRAVSALVEAAPKGGIAVLSGSQPPGVAETFPSRLGRALCEHDTRLILDTSGPPMRALLDPTATGPEVLRLDGKETADLAGRALSSRADVAGFAADLVARGVARMVVLAMGPDGSVLATGDGRWHSSSPPVPVRSRVGAGDSFVGAFALALSRAVPPPEALRLGVAAASAAVITDATDLCRREDAEALAKTGTLTQL